MVDARADGCFLVFEHVETAIGAVIAIQQRIADTSWPDRSAVRLRMGIHTGTAWLGPEGYVGLNVHRAARVMSAGHGGQVLLSGAAAQAIARPLPPGTTLQPLGRYGLRGLAEPESLYSLQAEGVLSHRRAPRAESVS